MVKTPPFHVFHPPSRSLAPRISHQSLPVSTSSVASAKEEPSRSSLRLHIKLPTPSHHRLPLLPGNPRRARNADAVVVHRSRYISFSDINIIFEHAQLVHGHPKRTRLYAIFV